jgi:DCN1-like protein 1/2
MEFCKDIKLDLEDVGILALSHELNSPQMGVFTRQGWTDGWRTLQCDSVASMGTCAAKLRSRLQSDSAFFRRIYMYAFEFAKSPGQRSIPIDNAKAFWSLLLPLALTSVEAKQDFKGWQPEYNDWWFEFLDVKKVKGISKDAWSMVRALLMPAIGLMCPDLCSSS